jgi:RNA polymerase-binding transcription factor DksA
MKEELLKKRKELMDRIDNIQADYRRGLDADSEERAVQLENRETLYEIERVCLEEIAKIDEQLKTLG